MRVAREDLRDLAGKLRSTRFSFIAPGEHPLTEIYSAVKAEYPQLCDDHYLCSVNCSSAQKQPEWQHVVRRALITLKGKEGGVSPGSRRGVWAFRA